MITRVWIPDVPGEHAGADAEQMRRLLLTELSELVEYDLNDAGDRKQFRADLREARMIRERREARSSAFAVETVKAAVALLIGALGTWFATHFSGGKSP